MQSCTVHINIYCVYVPSSCPKELSFLDVGSREVGQHLTKKEHRQNARNVSVLC